MTHALLLRATLVGVGLVSLAACSSTAPAEPAPPQVTESTAITITVTSTDSTCQLSANSAEPGPLTFAIRNDGAQPVDFGLYQADGTTEVGVVQAVEPGLTQDLSLDATEGAYIATCQTGSQGDPIRVAFTVL